MRRWFVRALTLWVTDPQDRCAWHATMQRLILRLLGSVAKFFHYNHYNSVVTSIEASQAPVMFLTTKYSSYCCRFSIKLTTLLPLQDNAARMFKVGASPGKG